MSGFNAADGDQVARRQDRDKRQRLAIDAGLKAIMSDSSGRAWLWDLLERVCGVHRDGFHQSNAQTAYHEGQRAVGLAILMDVRRRYPEQYAKMNLENQEKDNG